MNKKVSNKKNELEDVNHLKSEKSPYLLQHADNPVHWYPWSEDAFNKAKAEDKPIFLSIGYSTCHWCHVMEHESFENKEIADILNKYFVSIKVDREERPDIDNVYMKVVMSLTGNGGWPLTVFLMPDKKPFFGGTYFPSESKWGRPGMKELLMSIKDKWESNRENIAASSRSLTQNIKESISRDLKVKSPITLNTLNKAYTNLSNDFDHQYGGFGRSPKFPSPHNLSYMLRYWKRTKEQQALEIVNKTLLEMAKGGIYDQIGGGFHRYSTDQKWHVPHFEKMLYDQATLSKIYLEAYQVTGDEKYAQIATEIFQYVLRDMTDVKGGFYSAEDADSLPPEMSKIMSLDSNQSHQKSEGAYYIWRKQELLEILGKDEEAIFSYYFGIKNNGNAENDPHSEFIGQNILYRAYTIEDVANHFNKPYVEIKSILKDAKEKLFSVRLNRSKPYLDDKILVDWNGLMISSLAFGSRVLNEPRYMEAAENAAQFILKNMVTSDGRLLHRYRDNDVAISGTIEDYAFFIHGLIDLYEATFKTEYLIEAKRLAEEMIRLFEDEERGGLFFTAKDAEELLFRDKEIYDGAIPSGNSIGALDLIRLWQYTLDNKWEKHVQGIFNAFSDQISRTPQMYTQTLSAFDFVLGPSKEIVLVEGEDKEKIQQVVNVLYDFFIPNKIVIYRSSEEKEASSIISISPFIENQVSNQNKTTIYVCENYVCKFPVSDIDKLKGLLK